MMNLCFGAGMLHHKAQHAQARATLGRLYKHTRASSELEAFEVIEGAKGAFVHHDRIDASTSHSLLYASAGLLFLCRHRKTHQKRHRGNKLIAQCTSASPDGTKTTHADGSDGSSLPKNSWVALSRDVVRVAAPNTATFFLQLINEQTNVICLARTGNDAALAAVGLGNMMQNCFGLSIGWGLLGALDTLVSQAHGARQEDLACTFLQRGRLITTLQLVWIVPLLCSSEWLLCALGQDPLVSSLAAAYNRTSAPALLCLFQFQATAKFLQNQCATMPPMLINLLCSVLHVAWCALFVIRLDLGNAGAGLANAATWTTQWILITVYVLVMGTPSGVRRSKVLGFNAGSLQGWWAYLRVGIPCLLQTSSEWWFWEICALVVGFLGTVALAAHVVALQFVSLQFMLCLGVSSASAALVGNALGANDPQRAARLTKLCLALNLIIWTVNALCIKFGRHFIAATYGTHGEVSRLMQRLLIIYACAGYFDTTQNVMSGILRGMGRMAITGIVYICAYYGIMLPVGCLLAFKAGWGVEGIWWAFALGTSIATLIFSVVLNKTNWNSLAGSISKKMEAEPSL